MKPSLMEAVMAVYGELEFRQIGFLVADPTYRKNGAQKVVNFGVVTNVVWKDKATQGEKSRVEGFDYELWGEGAEHFAERMRKGSRVYVVGEPRNDRYENGSVTQYSIRIRVLRWQDLSSKPQEQSGKPRQDIGGRVCRRTAVSHSR